MDINSRIKEFERFYDKLTQTAPEGYTPWFFPCEKQNKNPDWKAIFKIDPKSKGSWHHESARLNKEECIEHIKQGYNIGISARKDDPLIIGDIDEPEVLDQVPKDTLTAISRKRGGCHFFGWDKDGSAKINLPTDYGEIRSENQYVLACGSYVPFNLKDKKDKKAFDKLPKEAREDKLIGYYTLGEDVNPKELCFDDFPQFFKEKEIENVETESKIKNRDGFEGKGKYSELFNLNVSDIIGLIPSNKRTGHPLHESDTDANWSLSKDGSIGHCWRHLVSLNAVQYLCVKTGYAKCEDAGTPHKGRGLSKIKGDKKAFESAYKEAVKLGLIKKYEGKEKEKENKIPTKYINRYVDEEEQIIVEQVYNSKDDVSQLCVYNNKIKDIQILDEWEHKGFLFYPQEGEELEKGAVLLPSMPEEYDEDKLDEEIKTFIKKWLDVPNEVIQFGIWNTKRSWVYDKFTSLNYLRALGDTGCGKSRYLNTFGNIHYTPVFTTGATTPAPLFRILDKWGGTLVMDEADLKRSDESDDVIKIINQGFENGNFIMRCDQNDASKISFFNPYSPKILATRRTFQDKATESRCITHVMDVTERGDIPVNLNEKFYEDSEKIRNKLLMWRFKNYFKIEHNKKYDLGDIEPRVRQIVSSYVALFGDNEKQMDEFKKYIHSYQEDLIEERRQSFEGSIVGAIYYLIKNGQTDFSAGDIIKKGEFTGKMGKPMAPRALNSYLKSLGFKTLAPSKVEGKTKRCIEINQDHIKKIFERYGYGVTKVTVVTGTSEKNNIRENNLLLPDMEGGVPLRNNRNNRNLCNPEDEVEVVKIKSYGVSNNDN